MTINKVCGSGLKAVMLAAQGIAAGDADIVVAGGMESMSNCPYLLPGAREGLRLGHGQAIDSMINDGLWCTFEDWHMGNAGEVVAVDYGITREAQDAFALNSHRKAADATAAGRFRAEIVPISIPVKEGRPIHLRSRRIDSSRDLDGGIGGAASRVQGRRHGDGGQRAAGQRRRRGRRGDVGDGVRAS